MIKKDNITINNKQFIKTYSDDNFMIKKIGTNEIYSEAYDLPNSNYNYEETVVKNENDTNNSTE